MGCVRRGFSFYSNMMKRGGDEKKQRETREKENQLITTEAKDELN